MSNMPDKWGWTKLKSGYLTAAVCTKGHVATEALEYGTGQDKHCGVCGSCNRRLPEL